MAYLSARLPMPDPAPEARPFWEYCRQKRLMFQRCGDCGQAVHPPSARCPACQSANRTWVAAPGGARVFTYTVIHHAADDSVAEAVPYNVVVVEFPDLAGVRLVSNVIDAAPDQLRVGMALRLVWEEGPNGQWLPRFARETTHG
jgi:uncharacterized OB-fold protein